MEREGKKLMYEVKETEGKTSERFIMCKRLETAEQQVPVCGRRKCSEDINRRIIMAED